MRIGELAARTNTSTRLLRYYEQQGLLVPGRSSNGYRDYSEAFVDQVIQIRGLLDGGLPTRVIKQILPCLKAPREIYFADASPEIRAVLRVERDRMTDRIAALTRNRDAIDAYLEHLEAGVPC